MDEKARSDHSSKGTHARPSSSNAWWRRPLAWLAGLFTAAALAGAAAFGSGVGHGLFRSATGAKITADPLQIESATYVEPGEISVAFPGLLSKKEVNQLTNGTNAIPIGDWTEFIRGAVRFGGAPDGGALIQIVVRNTTGQEAVVREIQVDKICRAPLRGTLLFNPSAGVNNDIEIGFNLDNEFPIAQFSRDNIQSLYGNYFADKTINMRPGDADSILIYTYADRYYCQFTFQLTVDEGSGQVIQKISDAGRPFVVTADTYPQGLGPGAPTPFVKFSDFERIYVGGVASPAGATVYTEVNPRTYNAGVPKAGPG
jgi:hypothetical protein